MSARKLKNIKVKEFKQFMAFHGLVHVRTKGGHEMWTKDGLARPVTIQNHVEPIPEFIVKNNLRTMGLEKEAFFAWKLSKKKSGKG